MSCLFPFMYVLNMNELCIGMVLLSLLLGCIRPKKGNNRLEELDAVVAYPAEFEQQKEERIAVLKLERERAVTDTQRLEAGVRLTEEYKVYIADSALYYAQEQLQLARRLKNRKWEKRACMQLAEVRIVTGMYQEALDLLNRIDGNVLQPELRGYYYHLYNALYRAMGDYAVEEDLRQEYEEKADRYRDSLQMIYSPENETHILVEAEQLISRGKYQKALERLLPYYATLDPDSREIGYTAYSIADAYRGLGNPEKEKEYLTVSALSDLKCGVKEYISLRELATLLYEEGDIRRAYAYMKRAMEDAAFCNARLRTVEVSQVLPIVNEAYRLQTERQRKSMVLLLLCISVLALFLIILAFYLRRQMGRLAQARHQVGLVNEELKRLNNELKEVNQRLTESNACLQETNDNLAEVNYIKEAYIGRFLDLCSTYIGKLDSYRRALNKKAMNGQTEELFRELKSTQLVEDELEEFYNNFDTAFLRLFPDFVQEFNALLAEGEEIILKPGELLNTELRIFALIRLGITDSNKIAQFLRYSLKTIYNYRTKMRNKARGNRDDFEKKVIHIESWGR